MPFIGNQPTAVPLSGADIQDGTIQLADLSATGTKDATTFLRGDNTFAVAGSPSIDDNGNATAITIDINERVGIGIVSPSEKLDVNGNIKANHVLPTTNDTFDLGASGNIWRNIYTGDLHLSNEAKSEGNAIDGTKGNWTIQEGAEDLYILNNKTGKKFKFKLEEIS